MKLTLSDFSYDIPEHLIAQEPLAIRSGSRLLVRDPDGNLSHSQFSELGKFLSPGTVLVYNDSKVIPGRILTQTANGGKLEFMLLRPINIQQNTWQALGKPFRKFKPGLRIQLDEYLSITVLSSNCEGPQPNLEISFSHPFDETLTWLEVNGFVPLPPYIHRKDPSPAKNSADKERYQTVYAQHTGSVAAPTAGLHFTPDLWETLKQTGVITAPLTLHVGGGTFLPVKAQEIETHEMHAEVYRVPRSSWEAIMLAKSEGRPLVCVGTTSLRCLESFTRRIAEGRNPEDFLEKWLETRLFIYPKDSETRVRPWGIDGIITNFHQPESSLLMLISALLGYKETRDLYQSAIREKYRFFSYGDASLLWLSKI